MRAKKGYVTLNAGSSSLKFGIFLDDETSSLAMMSQGVVENLGRQPRFEAHHYDGQLIEERMLAQGTPFETVLSFVVDWIEDHLAGHELAGVGHRVVHGGPHFSSPVRVDAGVIAALADLSPLAPLHQPYNLAPMRILNQTYPGLTQVACFDTAFHSTNPPVSRQYALPQSVRDAGIMRYGFHGLSYEYIAAELPRHGVPASARTIACHLGNGASMCAIKDGISLASTMGMSALDGLPMGTRCGTIDPGVILYLLREKGMSATDVEHMLYYDSGLLGLSGVSNDVRVLLASDDDRCRQALDVFVYRIAREIGSLAAALRGFDTLVFTAGIGENSSEIRRRVCEEAAWLGISLDDAANDAGKLCISTPSSKVQVFVIPTNEEVVIARHTKALAEGGT